MMDPAGFEPATWRLQGDVVLPAFAAFVIVKGRGDQVWRERPLSYGCNRGPRTPSSGFPDALLWTKGFPPAWSNVLPPAFATALFSYLHFVHFGDPVTIAFHGGKASERFEHRVGKASDIEYVPAALRLGRPDDGR